MCRWRREKVGFLVWHFLSQSLSSCLTVLPPLANRYGRHKLVKFLELPTCLSWRPGGHILFLLGRSFGGCPCFLHWPGERYSTHKSSDCIYPRSLKWLPVSLSLLNTEVSLMRKAVLWIRMTLDVTRVHYWNRMLYSYLTSLLMYHLN